MIDVERLRKIHALTGSPVAGEAAAAWNRVDAILARAGKTRADLPDLLAGVRRHAAAMAWPHPQRDTPRATAEEVRRFLSNARWKRENGRTRRPLPPLATTHPDLPFLHDSTEHMTVEEMFTLVGATMRAKIGKKDAAHLAALAEEVGQRRAAKEGRPDA